MYCILAFEANSALGHDTLCRAAENGYRPPSKDQPAKNRNKFSTFGTPECVLASPS